MKQTPANQTKVARVEAACEAVLDEVLQAGFFGMARLELVIADGTIQRISRTIERVDKER